MNGWLERYRGYILITLLNLLITGGALFFLRMPRSTGEIAITPPPPTATPLPTVTPRPLSVYVSGAVAHPDVYSLPADSIVKDAIKAAGGATAAADLNRINLARRLCDQEHIYVPEVGEESSLVSASSGPSAPTTPSRININTASQSELEALPGIGPSKAKGIIDHRPYKSIEGILKVPGIGEATFQKIRDLITVD